MSDSTSTLFASNTHSNTTRRCNLTKLFATRMIQGYKVTNIKCSWCDVPLMELKGDVSCVLCKNESQQQVAARSDVSAAAQKNATEDSIEITLDHVSVGASVGALTNSGSKNGKLLMAAIAGMVEEARRKQAEEQKEDARQEVLEERTGRMNKASSEIREEDGPGSAEPMDVSHVTHSERELVERKVMETAPAMVKSTTIATQTDEEPPPKVEPAPQPANDIPKNEEPPPKVEPAPQPANDIPKIKVPAKAVSRAPAAKETSPEEELEPTVGSEMTNRSTSPIPPPPAASPRARASPYRYPSPNRPHKAISINNLAKDPLVPNRREKTFTTPTFRGKNLGTTEKKTDNSCVSSNDSKKEVTKDEVSKKEVLKEEKVVKPTGVNSGSIPDRNEDEFFKELKQRARHHGAQADQPPMEEQAPPPPNVSGGEEGLEASVVIQPGHHDDISALGSQCSFESEVSRCYGAKKVTVQPRMHRPVIASTNVQQRLDVLPDDEKKDIAMECIKEFRPPLPFDEGSVKLDQITSNMGVGVVRGSVPGVANAVRATRVIGVNDNKSAVHLSAAQNKVVDEVQTPDEAESRLVTEKAEGSVMMARITSNIGVSVVGGSVRGVANAVRATEGVDANDNKSGGAESRLVMEKADINQSIGIISTPRSISSMMEKRPQAEAIGCSDSLKSARSDPPETSEMYDTHSIGTNSTSPRSISSMKENRPRVEAMSCSDSVKSTQSDPPMTSEMHDTQSVISVPTVQTTQANGVETEPQVTQVNPKESVTDMKDGNDEEVRTAQAAVIEINTTMKAAEVLLNGVESSTVKSVKSLRSIKTPSQQVIRAQLQEDGSLKSLPVIPSSQVLLRTDFMEELEEYKSKRNIPAVRDEMEEYKSKTGLSALVEYEDTEDVRVELDAGNDDAASISVKEIKISSIRGDSSTALASMNSKMEQQTRKLAQLEAEALRKHKEAEQAATNARVALEKMLEVRSKRSKAEEVDNSNVSMSSSKVSSYKSEKGSEGADKSIRTNLSRKKSRSVVSIAGSLKARNIKASEKESVSTASRSKYGSKEESKSVPSKRAGDLKTSQKETVSITSRSRYGSVSTSNISKKSVEMKSKQHEVKSELERKKYQCDLSMCSTLSEDSYLKFSKVAPNTGVKTEHKIEVASLASMSKHSSVHGRDPSGQLLVAPNTGDKTKPKIEDASIASMSKHSSEYGRDPSVQLPCTAAIKEKQPKRASLTDAPSTVSSIRSRLSSTNLHRSCSDASSSQYSQSYADGSSRSTHSGSSLSASTYSSRKSDSSSFSEIDKVESERNRASTRGSYRQGSLTHQRSKSTSPVEITKKKNLLLPSLMSPDPPSGQGKPSRREVKTRSGKKAYHGDKDWTRGRSHSVPRHNASRSRSKTSRKMPVDNDLAMSKAKSSTKPNYLLSYSTRNRSDGLANNIASHFQSQITPEGQRPTLSAHKPGLSDYFDRNHMSTASTHRVPRTGRDNMPVSQPQSGMLSPETRQLPHEQPNALKRTCTSAYHTPSYHTTPISLAGYKNREESFVPEQSTLTLPGGKIGRPETNFGRFALYQRPAHHSMHSNEERATPISLAGYNNREESFAPEQTTFSLLGGKIGRPETNVDRSVVYQRPAHHSMNSDEQEQARFKAQSTNQYPISRNVDSIALAYHTTFEERMAQASARHPASNFTAASMHTPLPVSNTSLERTYNSAGVVNEEHMQHAMSQHRVRFHNSTGRDLQYSTMPHGQESRNDSSFRQFNMGF